MVRTDFEKLKNKYANNEIDIHTYLLVLHLEIFNTEKIEKSLESILQNIEDINQHVTHFELNEELEKTINSNINNLNFSNPLIKELYKHAC